MKKILCLITAFALIASPLIAGTSTENLDLYKPSLGEEDWASEINSNFDKMDGIVSGRDTVTVDGADYILLQDTSDSDLLKKGLVSDITGVSEPALGNPAFDGYVLSSTDAGVRSWVPPEQGTQGEKGDKGDTGEKGDAGERGADGVVQSIVAGTNISVDSTDPANPIISASGSGGDVTSVFGRTGDVVATADDYTWAQIDKTTSDIAEITTRSHTSLSDIGTNSHDTIDSHLADTANPHSVTASQAGAVALTGDETVAGVKTFSSIPILPSEDPTADNEAVRKAYVDSVSQGLLPKNSCRVATASAGTLASSFENGDAVDTVTLATGNRILIKNQADGIENGIYTVNASGAPTRATDYDADAEVVQGTFTYVEEGSQGNTQWVQYAQNPEVGVDELLFRQLPTPNVYTASNGLNLATTDFKLGGTLTADTTITHGAYTLSHDLDGAGDFSVKDGGTTRFQVSDAGLTGIGTDASAGMQAFIKPSSDSTKGLVVRQNSSTQTASLQEWTSSTGTVLARILPSGHYYSNLPNQDQSAYPAVRGAQSGITREVAPATGEDETITTKYFAVKFTASSSYTAKTLQAFMKATGTITNKTAYMRAHIYSDSEGAPASVLSSLPTSVKFGSVLSSYTIHWFNLGGVSLTSGTSYWIVFVLTELPTGGTIELSKDAQEIGTFATSDDGASWSTATKNIYFEIDGVSGIGVYGYSYDSSGVEGYSKTGIGGYFNSGGGYGVYGVSNNGYGVYGRSSYSIGVYGYSEYSQGIYGQSGSGTAIYGLTTSGSSILGYSTSGTAVNAQTSSGTAINASTTTGSTIIATSNPATTDTLHAGIDIRRSTSGTASDGIGSRNYVRLEDSAEKSNIASTQDVIFTTATDGAETADYVVSLMNGGSASAEKFRIIGNGEILNQGAIGTKQVSTPSNPASGYNKLYFKSDDKLYKLNSAGTEAEVGSGGGSMTYPDAGLPISSGSAWGTSLSASRGGLVVGTGSTPAWSVLSAGTTGKVLTSDGTDISWETPTAGFTNPMTTLGDIIYENATPVPARLAGNTTTTKKFLSQTGDGDVSGAPAWSTLASGDIPSLSSVYLALAGGTLSGNVVMSKATPSLKLTDSGTSNYLELTKLSASNKGQILNKALRQGGTGKGMNFSGSTYVTIANESQFDFERTSPFSISFWIYAPSFTGGGTGLISKWSGSGQGWELNANDNGTIRWLLYDSSLKTIQSTNAISANTWTFVVVTYDGNGVGEFYMNNVLSVPTGATLTGSILNNTSVVVGARSDASRKLTAIIDELEIYDKRLSQSEASALYASGVGVYSTAGANHKLLIHGENDVNDASGNSNNGTWTGSASYATGKVLMEGTAYDINLVSHVDGVLGNEGGIITIGDSTYTPRIVLDGLTTRFNVEGAEKAVISSTGIANIDSFATFYGTASDSSVAFDGDSLNVKSNLVTSTDSLELTSGTTGMKANIGATLQYTLTDGVLTLKDGFNFVLGTTTGTKIGTATGQKLGFWNATPVVQPVFATGASHTVDELITVLQTLGLVKQS